MKQLSMTHRMLILISPLGQFVPQSAKETSSKKDAKKMNTNSDMEAFYLHRHLFVNKLCGNIPDTHTDMPWHKHRLPSTPCHLSLHGVLPVTVIPMAATRGLLLSSFRLSRISPLV